MSFLTVEPVIKYKFSFQVEHPGWNFAQIGKVISDEWKEVNRDDMEVLKEEAERMNAENISKLPKSPRSGKAF